MERHYSFIYTDLVHNESDMIGHIAYSLYKREKISYIETFRREKGRGPSDKELEAYCQSCKNPQRIQSYKKEATDLLQRFINISFDETSKQMLSDFSNEQEKLLKEIIVPLIPNKDEWPKKEKLRCRYIHGILQGFIGAILFPLLIGIALFAAKHSIDEIWLALADFFSSLAQHNN